MVYVGVDLHRKTSQVVALDDEGAVLLTRRVGSRPDELMRVFGELEPAPLEVAFEACWVKKLDRGRDRTRSVRAGPLHPRQGSGSPVEGPFWRRTRHATPRSP